LFYQFVQTVEALCHIQVSKIDMVGICDMRMSQNDIAISRKLDTLMASKVIRINNSKTQRTRDDAEIGRAAAAHHPGCRYSGPGSGRASRLYCRRALTRSQNYRELRAKTQIGTFVIS